MNDNSPRQTGYYLGLAVGLSALVGWFYLLRQLELIEWFARLGPETHTGTFNLLAIMLWMLPALLVWKYYLRWLNQRFDIRGMTDQERHDAMYADDKSDTKDTSDNSDSEGK